MDIAQYIASGILEEYASDLLPENEANEVRVHIDAYPELRAELLAIEESLEHYTMKKQVLPPFSIRAKVLERVAALPPRITFNSNASDYNEWLELPEHQTPEDLEEFAYSPINADPACTFVVVWFRNGEKEHVHKRTTETALLLEGTCEMTIDGETVSYSPGDVVVIQPGMTHSVNVTSSTPMKALVMRMAS